MEDTPGHPDKVRLELDPLSQGQPPPPDRSEHSVSSGDPPEDLQPLARAERAYSRAIRSSQHVLSAASSKLNCSLSSAAKLLVLIGFWAFAVTACVVDWRRSWHLLLAAIVMSLVIAYRVTMARFGSSLRLELPQCQCRYSFLLRYAMYLSLLGTFVGSVLVFNWHSPSNLKSLLGLLCLVLVSILISHDPAAVKWRPVYMGLGLQFLFALFTMRTAVGVAAFAHLGHLVRAFLHLSLVGIHFVFAPADGDLPWVFALQGLMVITFFSAVISVLYHWGVMQWVARSMAVVMQYTMQTSATESINAAGNIFVGMTEAPLLVQPFLEDMTLSELHAVMTGGFATIAGGVLASYVGMGISATHLISASVMSAPAALAFSKVVYPETGQSKTAAGSRVDLPPSPYKNSIHAISVGACQAMAMVLNIIANLVAFISIVQLLNAILAYAGQAIGIASLSLEGICQYVLSPLAFVLGADWADCLLVGEVIGTKSIVNEFVAYQRLGQLTRQHAISDRSTIIATYALCGFSNLGSIGVTIGGLSAMAESRRADLASLGFSAFLTGSIACFSTACIAGLLYDDSQGFQLPMMVNGTAI